MLREEAKDGGGRDASLAPVPLQALPDPNGSAGRSVWTDTQLQVRHAWRIQEKDPLANFVLCVSFSLRTGELGTMEWDAHAQFRGRVVSPARGAGVLEKGLETHVLERYLLDGWLILGLRTVGKIKILLSWKLRLMWLVATPSQVLIKTGKYAPLFIFIKWGSLKIFPN